MALPRDTLARVWQAARPIWALERQIGLVSSLPPLAGSAGVPREGFSVHMRAPGKHSSPGLADRAWSGKPPRHLTVQSETEVRKLVPGAGCREQS